MQIHVGGMKPCLLAEVCPVGAEVAFVPFIPQNCADLDPESRTGSKQFNFILQEDLPFVRHNW